MSEIKIIICGNLNCNNVMCGRNVKNIRNLCSGSINRKKVDFKDCEYWEKENEQRGNS